MASYTNTSKHSLRRLTGGSLVSEIDLGFEALSNDLDAIIATDDQGTFAARPVSTAGSPGKAGRYYYATDTGQLFRDTGTAWVEVVVGADARLSDQRAPKGPETNLKVIRGNVTFAGAVQNGSGFTVTKTATGAYTLTFSTVFSSPPAVTLTVVSSDGKIAGLGAFPLVGSALVRVLDPGVLALTDASFSFIAIGPA